MSALWRVNLMLVRVRITLRLAIYRQSIRRGIMPLETHDQIFFLNWTPAVVTSSPTRGRLYCLQLVMTLACAFILRSESRRTHDHILLSQIQDPHNLEARSPYLHLPETGWPSYNPRHWVPFPTPFTIRRAMVEVIRTPLHTLEGQSAMPWRVNSRRTE
jgi:hypothetical protein